MMQRGILAVSLAVAASVMALSAVATAHPLDLGYLRIEPSGDRIAVDLDLDVKAAEILLRAEGAGAAIIRDGATRLADRSFARAPIMTPAGPCTWAEATAELTGRTVKIRRTATCPAPGERRWSFPFVHEEKISSKFELLVKESVDGSERLTLVDKTTSEIVLSGTSAATPSSGVGFTDFLWSGIEHIGAAPNQWRDREGGLKLPDGIDHILFLLALMLGGGKLLQLVGIASGFTHSVTLALAALDVVRPPLSVIEPLIALSIALAAAEAFIGTFKKHRWKIATFFGLIHGFGFATALTHLDLTTRGKVTALFGYNLGVETGQLVIVLIVAPLVMFAYKRAAEPIPAAVVVVAGQPPVGTTAPRSPLVIQIAAGLIFLAGMYWFVQRLTA
jgi:hypothetical protein